MNAGGRMATQSLILGQGTIRLLPADRYRHTLNWEGKVYCRDPAYVVGTFSKVSDASMQDRLMVEISPPSHQETNSVQLRLQFGYTIELTTHKWEY
ncbi:hypothetical protein C8F04DRAFT_1091536 [Mycena alexandri]|uniref:Uncharacterized protein n=1 Tax=Mycena alexandri TaxID=1745969 RepID=A0AAD6X5W3_9AGAR|nr:hypothetical protein C8F04DRAFT_1091536 [Mycena alexandri]